MFGRLPKGATRLMSEKEALKKAGYGKNCKTVVYKRRCKGSKRKGTYRCHAISPVTVVRCKSHEGSLKRAAKRRFTKHTPCTRADLGVKGKKAHLFVSCERVARQQAHHPRRGH